MKPRVGVSGNVYNLVCEELSPSPHEGFIKTSLDILLKYSVSPVLAHCLRLISRALQN